MGRRRAIIMHAMSQDGTRVQIDLVPAQSTRQEAESSSQEERPREGADDGGFLLHGPNQRRPQEEPSTLNSFKNAIRPTTAYHGAIWNDRQTSIPAVS